MLTENVEDDSCGIRNFFWIAGGFARSMIPTFYIGVAGLFASLALAFLWQQERAESAALRGQFEIVQQQNISLKEALSEARENVNQSMELISENQRSVHDYSAKLNEAHQRHQQLMDEVNSLRTSELENAKKEPDVRAHAATERWSSFMRSIAGETRRESEGGDNSRVAKGSDSRFANSASRSQGNTDGSDHTRAGKAVLGGM